MAENLNMRPEVEKELQELLQFFMERKEGWYAEKMKYSKLYEENKDHTEKEIAKETLLYSSGCAEAFKCAEQSLKKLIDKFCG